MGEALTPAQIQRTVKKWVKLLRLERYTYKLIFDEVPNNADAYASNWTHPMYEEFEIQFNPGKFTDWTPEKCERIVVHELLHVHFKRLSEAYDATAEEIESVPIKEILQDRYEFEEEGVIDRLAHILVALK